MEKIEKIEKIDQNMSGSQMITEQCIRYINLKDSGISITGLPGYESDGVFSRLTSQENEILRKVNPNLVELGSHSAGGQISFRSDTRQLYLSVKLKSAYNMSNMPPAGQCGFDCYIGETREKLTFLGLTLFNPKDTSFVCKVLSQQVIESLEQSDCYIEENGRKMREFLIDFPLYCHVDDVAIGVDDDALIEPPSTYARPGKVVFYGTSITQGGCACRPGMAYTNMVTRKLNLEHVNYGFSGNGLGEYEVAEILAKIEDPLIYVIDYEANAGTNGRLVQSLEGFIERIRMKHADTPILVLSRIPFVCDLYNKDAKKLRDELREFQRSVVERMSEAGDKNIYFLDGTTLLPEEFGECTVDLVHPSDLGMYFMAEKLLPKMKEILGI